MKPASFVCGSVFATGLAPCDSGPQETWQPQARLEQQLKEKGWQVRRIKIDGVGPARAQLDCTSSACSMPGGVMART
ncbi:MAG: PepSY domain-containing protein [Steroidobacteraceae bacterium]